MTNRKENHLISPFIFYLLFYLYFTFGPVVAFYLGLDIYSGIKSAYLIDSVEVFICGVLGLLLSYTIRLKAYRVVVIKEDRLYIFHKLVLFLFIVVVLIAFVNLILNYKGGSKSNILNSLGSIHYVVMYFAPLILCIRFSLEKKTLFYETIIGGAFLFYCLVVGERDFILLFVPILLVASLKVYISNTKVFLLLLISSIAFTALSVLRASSDTSLLIESLLNQGSNLMVVSNVVYWLDIGKIHFLNGASYLDTFYSLMQVRELQEYGYLTHWFTNNYSANVRPGAYGFAIDAEAYLNFGYLGVFVFFLLQGYFFKLSWAYTKKGSAFFKFLSLYGTYIAIYAIRGDSNMLFKGIIYGSIIWWGIYMLTHLKIVFRRTK